MIIRHSKTLLWGLALLAGCLQPAQSFSTAISLHLHIFSRPSSSRVCFQGCPQTSFALSRRLYRGSRPRSSQSLAPAMALASVSLVAASVSANTIGALALLLTKKYKSALTKEGLLHAWILGCILGATLGLPAWTTCTVYLIVGSIATKIKKAEKEAQGIAEGRGGQRGPENVWGSAATAAICAILAAYGPYDPTVFQVGFAASLATKLSDTMASEIGKAYGKTTYLITTLELVSPGTEGAVSLEGTIAGVFGSIIIAVYAYFVGLITPLGAGMCLLAAFIATNIESLIGATAQGKVLWLTNEVVNFINTAIGALVAMAGLVLIR